MKTVGILAWALSRPWALHLDYMKRGYELLKRHADGVKLSSDELASVLAAREQQPQSRGYVVNNDGVAVVPVVGVIAKRLADVSGWCAPEGTSVEGIKNDIRSALADNSVRSIVLDIDSPGGTVDGVADLSQFIHSVRGQKPIVAFANGLMASAAYYIGSAADKIISAQDAEVGSIGVYAILEDDSEAYKAAGVRFEMIRAGKFKGEGHHLFPITPEARALTQETVDDFYSQFVGAVARNRGVPVDGALAWANGKTYVGERAKALGLVDVIGTLESAIQYAADLSGRILGGPAMDKKTEAPAGAQGKFAGLNALTVGEFKIEAPDLFSKVKADVLREDRERVAGISAAIKETGLEVAVQAALSGICADLSVDAAKVEITRASQIEAALAGAGLSAEDVASLRGDIAAGKLPSASAIQLIKGYAEAKRGAQSRLVNAPDQAVQGLDAEKKQAAARLAEAVKAARADFAKVRVVGVSEAAYVGQCLDMAGIKVSADELKAALADQK